jgi:hypothetical protein
MASLSWNLLTSPCSYFTLSCRSRFFLSFRRGISTKVRNGLFEASSRRLELAEGARVSAGVIAENAGTAFCAKA